MGGNLGGRRSGGIFRNSASEMQFTAAPVSNNQVLVSPCTLSVINGRATLSEKVEQMFVNENALRRIEQTVKNVGTNCLLLRWCEAYKLGEENIVLGWMEQRGSTDVNPLRSENPAEQGSCRWKS